MLQLQTVLEDYEVEGLEMITITKDMESVISDFWEEEDLSGKVFIDEEAEIFLNYEVSRLPAGAFIDKEGQIEDQSTSWHDDSLSEWQQKADELLESP